MPGRSDAHRRASRSRVVQRPRRLRRRRPRIRRSTSHQDAGTLPPAPWANVVAHPTFGFAATESGPGFTWSENSHDNRLTPWRNDPVSDPPGEAVFIRDEETGRVLVGDAAAGRRRPAVHRPSRPGLHAPASTRATGSRRDLPLFVAAAEPVKVFQLALRNTSAGGAESVGDALRRVGARREPRARPSHRHEPRAGDRRAHGAQRLSATISPDRVAFLDLLPAASADASPATGRNSSAGTARSRRPPRSRATALSDRTGAALDPCGAVQVRVDPRAVGEERTLIGLLGEAASDAASRRWCGATATPQGVDAALARRARVLGSTARHAAGHDARSRDGPDAQSLAALPDAGLPHLGTLGLLSVERRLRIPRSAAGRARAALSAPASGARAHRCTRPRGSSSKATCSTGGTSRAARACARDSRTIACGWSFATLQYIVGDRRRLACSTSWCRFSKAGRSSPTSTKPTSGRRSRQNRRRSTSTASAPSRSTSRPARTACR